MTAPPIQRRTTAQTLAAAQKRQAKVYYPQSLVVLTAFMETFQSVPTGADAVGSTLSGKSGLRFNGGVRQVADTIQVAVRPSSVRVVRNSYQQPDSFTVEFDHRALPLSAKQIKSCAVEVYLWNAPYLGASVPQDANGNILLKPVIMGLADEIHGARGGDGSTIVIDGQDYTSLFSQRDWDTRKRMPTGLRLDLQLEGLVREGDSGGVTALRVEPESLRASLPIVGSVWRRVNKKGIPIKDKSTWWDVMYRMAQTHGFILFVEGTDIVLSKPHVLHQARAGQLPGAEPLRPVYSLAWGRNISDMEDGRRMGKELTPTIEVRSYDERTQKTIRGRYPTADQKATTGVGTERKQVKVYSLPGISSESILREAARSVYELIAKGEQTIRVATKDLRDLLGNDLFQMRSGDAMGIDLDVFNTEELARLPQASRVARLRAAGFPDSVADYVARNYDLVDVMRGPFRIREVTYDFSTDDGVGIDIELQDFVRVNTETI